MKFCQHCGKELHDEAAICVHCGCSVQATPDTEVKSVDESSEYRTAASMSYPQIRQGNVRMVYLYGE